MQRGYRRAKILPVMVWSCLVVMSLAYPGTETAAQAPAPAQSNEQAQIQKGRETVGQVCTPCHNNILRIIQIHKKSAPEWRNTVYSMIGRGAMILPDEVEPLTAFLASNAARPSAAPPVLPEAEGKTLLQRHCQQCHDLDVASRRPAAGDWKTVITRMIGYGANVSAPDQQKLADYLTGLTR
jgi:cytochrome c5